MSARTIVLAAGGTGGHLFPARALARELSERGHRPILVTDTGGPAAGDESLPVHHVSAGGVVGKGKLGKALGAAKLGRGYVQAHRLLRRLAPDTVVGFGGYGALPTAMAGAHQGRRVVLHEQNAVAGRANRVLARRAHAVVLGFPDPAGLPHGVPATLTGNPVRGAIARIGAHGYLAPGPDDPVTLLVVGGSQGARAFNELIPAAVARLPGELRGRLRIVQQVPGEQEDAVRAAHAEAGVAESEVAAFFTDMPDRLHAAHLVVARAGASTVTELAAAGRPAVLIPFPHAADDHQTANAEAAEAAGAAWLMPEPTLTPAALAERLGGLLHHPGQLVRAAEHARVFAVSTSAARLADLVTGEEGAR